MSGGKGAGLACNIPLNPFHTLDLRLTPNVFENVIHVLERSSSRFGHENPSPGEAQATEYCEEGVCPETSVLNHWRCDESDDEVVQPVAARG